MFQVREQDGARARLEPKRADRIGVCGQGEHRVGVRKADHDFAVLNALHQPGPKVRVEPMSQPVAGFPSHSVVVQTGLRQPT